MPNRPCYNVPSYGNDPAHGRATVKVIGLTGGIGAGKGAVASILRSLGAVVIDADQEAHRVYRKGTEGWRRVVSLFGEEVLNETGEIDRQRLGQAAFTGPGALERLNAALHPLIREAVSAQLGQWRQEGRTVAVVEAPLLLEAGWQDMVDGVWVVEAPAQVVVARLRAQRGLDEEVVKQRMQAQTSADWKREQACVVIDNSGTREELRSKVQSLWEERIKTQR